MPDVHLPIPFQAYPGSEPYIFVSYAHKDGPGVFAELRLLRERGFRIWYDEGIDPGNEWPEEIAKALDRAAVFLVFISKQAIESRNVRNEINFALNREKPFLAIHLEDTQLPPGLELRMGDIQAILKWRMDEEHYWKKVISAIPTNVCGSPSKPDHNNALELLAFKVAWSCRLSQAIYSPIQAVVPVGREILCISSRSADAWVYALHNSGGKLLWQFPAGDHRVELDRVAWNSAHLYLTGEIEVEPDLRFARKIDLREGDTLVSLCWYDRPPTAQQVRDQIPEWDQLPWRAISDIERQSTFAESKTLRVSVVADGVRIEKIAEMSEYTWETPGDDPLAAVAISGDSRPVVAFNSGRICMLEEVSRAELHPHEGRND